MTLFACSSDKNYPIDTNSSPQEETIASEDAFIKKAGELHNDILYYAEEIIKEKGYPTEISSQQARSLIDTSVRTIVERYINETQGRPMTSAEKATFSNVMNKYSGNTKLHGLMNTISNTNISSTGNKDLNSLYSQLNIHTDARKYFNKLLSLLNNENFKSSANQLYKEVQNSSLPEYEKQHTLTVISIGINSYDYWKRPDFGGPQTRLSNADANRVIKKDMLGALGGFIRGLTIGKPGLIFGPGGYAATLIGHTLIWGAAASVERGLELGWDI